MTLGRFLWFLHFSWVCRSWSVHQIKYQRRKDFQLVNRWEPKTCLVFVKTTAVRVSDCAFNRNVWVPFLLSSRQWNGGSWSAGRFRFNRKVWWYSLAEIEEFVHCNSCGVRSCLQIVVFKYFRQKFPLANHIGPGPAISRAHAADGRAAWRIVVKWRF